MSWNRDGLRLPIADALERHAQPLLPDLTHVEDTLAGALQAMSGWPREARMADGRSVVQCVSVHVSEFEDVKRRLDAVLARPRRRARSWMRYCRSFPDGREHDCNSNLIHRLRLVLWLVLRTRREFA